MIVYIVTSMDNGECEGCVAVCATLGIAKDWVKKNKHKYTTLYIEPKRLIGG